MANSDEPRIIQARELGRRIRAARIQQGWDLGHLARLAEISRTTLYRLEQGRTLRPRTSILARISRALGPSFDRSDGTLADVDSATSLLSNPPHEAHEGSQKRQFNRETNPLVDEVAQEYPGLFRDWTDDEWDELYSSFGTGGALTTEGVVQQALRTNRKRRTIRQLHVVLETHLDEVAIGLIETLYQMLRPTGTGPSVAIPDEPASNVQNLFSESHYEERKA